MATRNKQAKAAQEDLIFCIKIAILAVQKYTVEDGNGQGLLSSNDPPAIVHVKSDSAMNAAKNSRFGPLQIGSIISASRSLSILSRSKRNGEHLCGIGITEQGRILFGKCDQGRVACCRTNGRGCIAVLDDSNLLFHHRDRGFC